MKSIGIIGAENSHTIAIAKEINIREQAPGFTLAYVWGETAELAAKAAEEGQIPHVVSDPGEMLGKVDAVICDHRHPKYHLDSVRPFVAEGIPTFVDKPFCFESARGEEFLAFARKKGTPVTSFSVMSHQKSFFALEEELKTIGDISAGATYGPCDLESQYGGVFFYGVHQVDMALHAFGYDVEQVAVIRNRDGFAVGELLYPDGRIVTLNFIRDGMKGFALTAAGSDGYLHRSIVRDEHPYLTGVTIFTSMFESGIEPIPHDEILAPIRVLEALQRSIDSGGVERV